MSLSSSSSRAPRKYSSPTSFHKTSHGRTAKSCFTLVKYSQFSKATGERSLKALKGHVSRLKEKKQKPLTGVAILFCKGQTFGNPLDPPHLSIKTSWYQSSQLRIPLSPLRLRVTYFSLSVSSLVI